jgi:hypothetical protein
MNLKGYEFVGMVAVDSGQVMIIDPCYVISERFNNHDYKTVCETTNPCGEFFAAGMATAVASDSGCGDGRYPVFARKHDLDQWGRRVVELRIFFEDVDGVIRDYGEKEEE